MAATQIGRRGFGQVEPNHLSGIITGQILAMLPVDTEAMGTIIENGRFAKYDYATGKVNLTGPGEWMLIYNEIKLYDERKQSNKDFAMIADNYTEGEIVPRLISTVLGDVYTTNTFGKSEGKNSPITLGADLTQNFDVDGISLDVGNKLYVGTDGYLAALGDEESSVEGPVFQVVKVYTMADGQPGVKIMRIA
jgi:hypothetical protein